MIRRTLDATKEATFSIILPGLRRKGMVPTGTGFFVSPDGWFVTAAHVITENHLSDGPVRNDISRAWLMQESRDIEEPDRMCQAVSVAFVDPSTDFALLKVDFQANHKKDWLRESTSFPFIEMSSRELEEGEPVYSFGYPLSSSTAWNLRGMIMGTLYLSPRVTSAIVSSTFEKSEMIVTGAEPKVYLLDKALNYGNSGGPIVATETGKVHAFCSRFQPVGIPQDHIQDQQGNPMTIYIPSLYGVVSSLANPAILKELYESGVPISDD